MKKELFIKTLNSIAPFDLQYEWDNSGVQINLGHEEVKNVLVAMEITHDVIDEAIENGVDLILTHHPLIFSPIRKVDIDNIIQQYITRLVVAGIEVISCHTNFDVAKGGNNDYLMKLMGVSNAANLMDQCGRIGTLSRAVSFEKFVCKLDETLGNPGIKFNGNLDKPIKKIACCTGAGSDYIEAAIHEGADVFVSGDIKHNQAQMAKEFGMCLVDAGQWGTEQIFVPNMSVQLKNKAKGLKVMMSTVNQNPFDSIM